MKRYVRAANKNYSENHIPSIRDFRRREQIVPTIDTAESQFIDCIKLAIPNVLDWPEISLQIHGGLNRYEGPSVPINDAYYVNVNFMYFDLVSSTIQLQVEDDYATYLSLYNKNLNLVEKFVPNQITNFNQLVDYIKNWSDTIIREYNKTIDATPLEAGYEKEFVDSYTN